MSDDYGWVDGWRRQMRQEFAVTNPASQMIVTGVTSDAMWVPPRIQLRDRRWVIAGRLHLGLYRRRRDAVRAARRAGVIA